MTRITPLIILLFLAVSCKEAEIFPGEVYKGTYQVKEIDILDDQGDDITDWFIIQEDWNNSTFTLLKDGRYEQPMEYEYHVAFLRPQSYYQGNVQGFWEEFVGEKGLLFDDGPAEYFASVQVSGDESIFYFPMERAIGENHYNDTNFTFFKYMGEGAASELAVMANGSSDVNTADHVGHQSGFYAGYLERYLELRDLNGGSWQSRLEYAYSFTETYDSLFFNTDPSFLSQYELSRIEGLNEGAEDASRNFRLARRSLELIYFTSKYD